MKRIVISMMILSLLVMANETLCAAQKKPASPPALSPAVRKEAEVKAKTTLAAKEWTVYLTAMGQKKAGQETDVLNFAEGKLSSKNLSSKGYPTSNCTITVQPNGTIIWETMQTTEKGEMAFWRGELEGGAMRGVLSLQSPKGQARGFSFTNISSTKQ
ncbi:MAG: hypothetical protein PHG87_02605 [Candidatus Omnitrophica bacterium]|nr:hypothetical protein [Candidatus Omnitrophota bacterium]